jgi:hypothetical protein
LLEHGIICAVLVASQSLAQQQKGAGGNSELDSTPYEKLTSVSDWQKHLKAAVTEQMLKREAEKMSDTEAARRMQKAKLALLAKCRSTSR